MAVRDYDGVDDKTEFATGGFTDNGSTYAILVKLMSADTAAGLLMHHDSFGFVTGGLVIGGTGQIQYGDDGAASVGPNVGTGDGWVLLVGTKAAGASVPRFHKFPLGGSWTHSNGTAVNVDTSSTQATLRVGEFANSDFADVRVAVAAHWNANLTDTEVEDLAVGLTTGAWADVQPSALQALYDFNQAATTTQIRDLSEKGRHENAEVGTTAVTGDDPPGWTFGVPTDPPTRAWFNPVAHAAGTSWATSFGGNSPAANDILVLFLATGNSTVAITGGLTGWTLLDGPRDNTPVDARGWLYWKRAAGGDTAPTVTFGASHAGQSLITCYSDASTGVDPWDAPLTIYGSTVSQAFTDLNIVTSNENSMLTSFITEDKSGTLARPNFTSLDLTVYVDAEDSVEWTNIGAGDAIKAVAGPAAVEWIHDSDGIVAYLAALRGLRTPTGPPPEPVYVPGSMFDPDVRLEAWF